MLSRKKGPRRLLWTRRRSTGRQCQQRLVRPLIAATDEEVTASATGQPGAVGVHLLDPVGDRVRPLDPGKDPGYAIPVLGDIRPDKDGVYAAEHDRCPACGM